ncbi:MAG: GntR family transcriptional regulator [Anaerolineae bacterium]|nr:GntR family transcriptional regulator [Gemmatimonadaceae bacterium]
MSTSTAIRIDASQVYDRLRSLIIRGQLAPGVRVVENDIALRLGVSRTPAREAILRLYQEGFLVPTGVTRRTELLVAPLTLDDMMDLYHVMASLEGAAARRIDLLETAARRDLAARLKQAETRFENAARQRTVDYDRLFELHNEFHGLLVDSCARPRLRAMIETVRPQVYRYEWVYAPLVGPNHSATFEEHAEIIKTVRAGSGRVAQQAVAANWEKGAERLGRVIGSVGARGEW